MEHEIISRKEAKARGLKFYFTGKPCKRGGIAQRRVSSRDCLCDTCVRIFNEKIRTSRDQEQNRKYLAALREDNPEKVKEYKRRDYERHQQNILSRVSRWQKENHDKFLRRKRLWAQRNPGKARYYKSSRRASKQQAIPLWFSEWDEFVIQESYSLASVREAESGMKWHVDHMIPLRARKACGLHCAANIQVIPAKMNLEKKNKLVLTEPLEWLR